MIKILIGIQARSGSSRLPNKIHAVIGDKTCLDHVINACKRAQKYLMNANFKIQMLPEIAVLIPFGDPVRARITQEGIAIVEGPEKNVLTRYMMALKKNPCDFVARITADCPKLPDNIISKVISLAVVNGYDYISNVDERCRTSPNGHDCEVISKRAMEYLDSNALLESDREHVTPLLRTNPPPWLKQAFVINRIDQSNLKFAVDTDEDLERVRLEHDKFHKKYRSAIDIFGKTRVHRF